MAIRERVDGFFLVFLLAQGGLIALYWTVTDYDKSLISYENDITGGIYKYGADVAIMIMCGFGFLMTFLKKYMFGAVGLNFLVSAFCIEWAILVIGFWRCVHTGVWNTLHLNLASMIDGNFGAGSCMIAFGALIGKVTPGQMLFIGFWQMIFYGLNYFVIQLKLKVIDIGGSLVIHTFGAYFGLAVSMCLSPRTSDAYKNNGSNYNSDVFSMIGTIFLWLNWPSFNAAFALPFAQPRAVLNTFLSLCSCVLSTFLFSRLYSDNGKKFDMVHVQNATLAGGVAVGAAADLLLGPGGAMLIGFAAGGLSTTGFRFLQSLLDSKIGLKDTCGVHNLHGMPGVLGGLVSVIAAAQASDSLYGTAQYTAQFPQGADQAKYQLAGIGITLGIAIVSGALVGLLTRLLTKLSFFTSGEGQSHFFEDELLWRVEEGNAASEIELQSQRSVPVAPQSDTVSKQRSVKIAPSPSHVEELHHHDL